MKDIILFFVFIFSVLFLIILWAVYSYKNDHKKFARQKTKLKEEEQHKQLQYENIRNADADKSSSNISQYKIIKSEYNKLYSLVSNYIVFDLETTGLDCSFDDIIEIGAIKFEDNTEVSRFHSYVNIKRDIPKKIVELTGITNEMIRNAPELEKTLADFKKFISDSVLIAHNSNFDMKFLQTNYNRFLHITLDNSVIDTLALSRKYLKNIQNHKLVTIKEYFDIQVGSHNALDDCEVTSKLYQYCFEQYHKFEYSGLAKEVFDTTLKLLNDKGLKTNMLSLNSGSNYTDILYYCFAMLRFKTKGRLIYWLVDIDADDFNKKYTTDIKISVSSASEGKKTRLFITSGSQIIDFSDYIIKEYHKCEEQQLLLEKAESHKRITTYKTEIVIEKDENGNSRFVSKHYEE